MRLKFEYTSQEQRQSLIIQHSDKTLVEEQNILDGNFLIFSEEPPNNIIYTQVNEEEFNRIKAENETLKASVIELTTYSSAQEERFNQAITELTILIAGSEA